MWNTTLNSAPRSHGERHFRHSVATGDCGSPSWMLPVPRHWLSAAIKQDSIRFVQMGQSDGTPVSWTAPTWELFCSTVSCIHGSHLCHHMYGHLPALSFACSHARPGGWCLNPEPTACLARILFWKLTLFYSPKCNTRRHKNGFPAQRDQDKCKTW